ncbi:MAG TPA: FHA domain-containing protein [Candidatus Deferrimicrobiaceae bacterium]|nr:FHA domain-containing protein [Candidatus Deferrimicrobiaceae bacterium]
MDPAVLAIWLLRLLFLAGLYLFLWLVVRALLRDLRAAAREPLVELGRLVVVATPSGDPAPGSAFRLEAVTTLGRDVNNSIVLDDEFVSLTHAALTYRGRAWYLEDLGSTNGTFVNGVRVAELSPLAFGDEIQVGQVRLRLERARA